jgi:hypothetical protein
MCDPPGVSEHSGKGKAMVTVNIMVAGTAIAVALDRVPVAGDHVIQNGIDYIVTCAYLDAGGGNHVIVAKSAS